MNSHLAAAMSRALEQTRAGKPGEATRLIQAVLAGDTVQPDHTAALDGPPSAFLRRPSAEIADAEVVEVHPPRRSGFPFAAQEAMPGSQAGPRFDPADLQRMLGNPGCMAPQGLPDLAVLGQGLRGMNARPHVPEGARYETRSFTSAHGARDYRLFVPSSRPEGPKGLVLMLHGCTQNPDDFASGTDMNSHAERHGLIVVYPHQSRAHNAQGCWNWFRPEDQRAEAGEAALLAALTRAVAVEFSVP
ncbi:PHB depolymerase family esterase, partial [Paracoccus sp. Z118]|uniref:alpha/beta hydrolase family esterase n=1 Tax=Paracoccus sp. Z118 TaxID=2851017 RepID=UPI001C2C60F7